MHPDDTLRAALSVAYRAFNDVPCPGTLEASPHRDGAKILRSLTSAPLRHLTDKQIGPYAGWAITTVGSEMDYRYFLPRILELAVESPTHMGLMAPVIADRIIMGNWMDWPNQQRRAILDVFRAAFERAVEAHPDDMQTAPEWLCGLARLGQPVDVSLAFWRSSNSQNATLQLASFTMMTLEILAETGDALAGFWEAINPQTRQAVCVWVQSVETRHQLEAALADVPTNDKWMVENALNLARRTTN